jgi:hypothetical protein
LSREGWCGDDRHRRRALRPVLLAVDDVDAVDDDVDDVDDDGRTTSPNRRRDRVMRGEGLFRKRREDAED